MSYIIGMITGIIICYVIFAGSKGAQKRDKHLFVYLVYSLVAAVLGSILGRWIVDLYFGS